MYPLIRDLTLDLLQTCYQNCQFCSSNSSKNQNIQLNYEIVLKIIKEFSELGGNTVELSGGEPLAYKKISELIDFSKENNLEVHLFTCCELPKRIDYKIIKKVDKVFVNLQAPNKELQDYLTCNPGSFEKVIKFIKMAKTEGMWVGTHLIPLKYNIDEIEDYIKFAKELELENVSILRFVEQGRGKNNKLELSPEEILQLHSIIEKCANSDKPRVKIGCPLDFQFIYNKKLIAKPCVSGISRCVVRPNGNVIPCPAFKDSKEFVAGNVNTNSFKDIWENGEVFQKIREFDYKNLRGLCSKCNFLTICKGRCHAQRIHKNNDFYLGPDPYCPLYLYHVS